MNDLTSYETVPMEQLRDSVMEDLVRQYSLEHLDMDEFERRTEQVSKAISRSELLAQISDLPELPRERRDTGKAAPAGSTTWRINSGNVKPNDFSVAIFGGSDFRGGMAGAAQPRSPLCLWRLEHRPAQGCGTCGGRVDQLPLHLRRRRYHCPTRDAPSRERNGHFRRVRPE